ncbi:hypothetical protein FORC55_3053 [Vibrio cholerae]|nr:hypothetical protein FORC55_3053 [Vibrio cholerae]
MEVNHVLADEKLIIALISAAVALLLGQLVVYIKYRINKWYPRHEPTGDIVSV